MLEDFSLKNKVSIVTGAAGLLGKEHCKALAEAGSNVVVCDLDEKVCVEIAANLETKSMGVGVDITDKNSLEVLKQRVLDKWGRIDVLVNNAAINEMFENPKMAAEMSKFENLPLDVWQKMVDVNITGMFLICQVVGSYMAEQGYGSIINVASTYGIVAPDQSIYRDENGKQKFYKSPAYPTTKGAVLNFTRYLAAYWGEKGVRVNTLSPGGVENNQDTHFQKLYSNKTPLGRMSKRTEYRGAVVFLASDASSYMTGANLVVDGGWTCW